MGAWECVGRAGVLRKRAACTGMHACMRTHFLADVHGHAMARARIVRVCVFATCAHAYVSSDL
jgi:hypothetical protein